MKTFDPEAPFVWPEPRAIEALAAYEHQPPFEALARAASTLIGVVAAPTGAGIALLESWLRREPKFTARLVVVVYPACATRQTDLERLLHLTQETTGRLLTHVRPLVRVTDREATALCFKPNGEGPVHLVFGISEDFGLSAEQAPQLNLAIQADPILIEAFSRTFNWMWANSNDIAADGAVAIPALVLPSGDREATEQWRAYMQGCTSTVLDDKPALIATVDEDTGDVTIASSSGEPVPTPTEDAGLPKLDAVSEQIARIYKKGTLVSIDKLSRIPPLDVPLDPSMFGDIAERHRGGVTRKVTMRVSIIDANVLKEIEKYKNRFRTLLNRFTFGLGDNMRWMPTAASGPFQSELERVNAEGQRLIANLVTGDVDAFIASKSDQLVASINAMYADLGRLGSVTPDVIEQVKSSFKDRLSRASSLNFMPKLSNTVLEFARTENEWASPWGQAFSLLSDAFAYPRKAVTDGFFFRGLETAEDELIEAMNVTNDAILKDLEVRGIKKRCEAELKLLEQIEKAAIESRARCELVCQLIAGQSADMVAKALDDLIPVLEQRPTVDQSAGRASVEA